MPDDHLATRAATRRLRILPCLLAALLAVPAAAAEPAVERRAETLQERALASDLAWRLVESLTTEVGHRLAGSEGDRRAVAWALATLEELGFTAVRAEPVAVPHWVRGEAQAAIVSPHPQPLAVLSLGGSVGTSDEGVTAEVVRFGSVAELAAAPDEAVRGRVVFLDQAMEAGVEGKGYGDVVDIRTKGAATAGPKGAVAVVIRSVGTGPHRFAHTGTTRYEEGGPRIPALALAVPDADLLARQLAGEEPVVLYLRSTARTLPDATSANVLAEVRGSRRPEEIVLLACHLDSWDVGTGANDDGAGCAIVIAAARLLAELPGGPERTIRLLLAANEEFGLHGAKAYAAAHAEELPRHRLAIEADAGSFAPQRFSSRFAPAASPLAERIARALAPLGIVYEDNDSGGGADLIPLRPHGVPFAGIGQDSVPYFDVHHTEDDTLANVDAEGLRANVAAYATVALFAAESDDELRPVPPFPKTE